MNILKIFQRSKQYLPLTPHERAILKFLEGLAVTAITAALVAVAQLILNKGNVSWQEVWMVAATAAGVAVLNAFIKFFRARSDPQLTDILKPVEAPAANTTQEG